MGNPGFKHYVLALALFLPPGALQCPAAGFTDSLTAGISPANWAILTNDNLSTFSSASQGLTVSRSTASSNSFYFATLACHFAAQGDFSVQVTFTNLSINRTGTSGFPGNQLQLNCRFGGQDFLVVRSDEEDPGQQAHVWLAPQEAPEGTYDTSATSGTLSITRTGTTVAGYFNSTLLYQGTFNTNDAAFSLALQDNNTSDPISVVWSNFQISADNLVITPPALEIQQQGSNCVITWPDRSWPDGYANTNVIQSATNLPAGTNWQTNSVSLNEPNFYFTNGITGTATFFRLRQGP